jgi:hypothetical protein
MTIDRESSPTTESLGARNARTARWLLLWIACLMLVSLATIWLRN